jgi:WD40 repeat protein
VAAFGHPDRVDVWELQSGRGIETLGGLVRNAFRSVFSPNGRLVAVLSNDWHVGIWNRASHRLDYILEVSPGFHFDNAALAFSADGGQFAFSSGREAGLWDLATGEVIKTWELSPGLGDHLAFPAADRLVLFRQEAEQGDVPPVREFDPSKYPRVCRIRNLLGADPLKPLAEIRDCNLHVNASECSPDGRFYAIEGRGGSRDDSRRIANLYEGMTGKLLGPLPTQFATDFPYAMLNFDPSGTVLNYLSSNEGRAFFLELPSRAIVRQFDTQPHCVGPRGTQWLRASGATADHPRLFSVFESDRANAVISFVLDVGGTMANGQPVFSADGRRLLWGNANGMVTVVDLVEVQHRLAELDLGW